MVHKKKYYWDLWETAQRLCKDSEGGFQDTSRALKGNDTLKIMFHSFLHLKIFPSLINLSTIITELSCPTDNRDYKQF